MSTGSRCLRVLLVIDSAGAHGGAERFVSGLALHLPRDRIEPWVCSTRFGDELAIADLRRAGIPHLNIGRSGKRDAFRLSKLVSLIRHERFDVVHAHKFGSNLWCTLIGRACSVPVVIAHEHTWSYAGNPPRAWLDGHVIGRLATRFVAVSRADAERMVSVEGVPPAKVVVMPTGYIPHRVSPNGDIRTELGIKPDAPLVAVAAQLRPQKALDVMIEAHAQVVARVRDAHLVIAGQGPGRHDLEQQIGELGIGDSVHLLGVRHDVDAILSRADVGALSSDFEGLPLFVFECMAAGTPLVATSVGGLPDVVADGTTGILVPRRNPWALADAIVALLTDRGRARRLADAAAERLEAFTIDAVAAQFAGLYEQLVSEVGQV